MSDNFFPSRGCVYAVPTGSGSSLYNLESFSSTITGGTGPSVVLLSGLELTARDLILPVNTTTDFQVLYVFGKDFGNAQLNGEILLGSEGQQAKVNEVISWFESNRVGVRGQPVRFSMGSKAFMIHIHGMLLGNPDPQFNIQPFAFVGTQVGKAS